MILSGLLGCECGDWEEGLAASLYIQGRRLETDRLEDRVSRKVEYLLHGLEQLPGLWARELALQVLMKEIGCTSGGGGNGAASA